MAHFCASAGRRRAATRAMERRKAPDWDRAKALLTVPDLRVLAV